MNVLFCLTQAFNPNDGGVQRTTYKLGKHFSEHGIAVSYYSFAQKGHINADYGQLFHAPESGNTSNPANISHLALLLENTKPDIVINQMPYEAKLRDILVSKKNEVGYVLLGCLRNSLFSVVNNLRDTVKRTINSRIFPLVDHKLGLAVMLQLHKWKHAKKLKAILDAHDKYILLTPQNNQELQYFIGRYKQEKTLYIPNSIPAVIEKPDGKEKIILHVGRLNDAQKRSDLLLEFWNECHSRIPEWKFVIVGDGPYLSVIKEKQQQLQLPRISFEGYQSPEAYYRRSAIFMMPSAYEGFPNTILEAQSYGCAVFAFNSYPALEWIVNDQKDGILPPPFNVRAMADATVALAKNGNKLLAMQNAALHNARRFTIDQVGANWIELFKNLLGES